MKVFATPAEQAERVRHTKWGRRLAKGGESVKKEAEVLFVCRLVISLGCCSGSNCSQYLSIWLILCATTGELFPSVRWRIYLPLLLCTFNGQEINFYEIQIIPGFIGRSFSSAQWETRQDSCKSCEKCSAEDQRLRWFVFWRQSQNLIPNRI